MQSQTITGSTTSSTGSRILLTLDPGIRIAGPAIFVGQKLKAATLIKNPIKTGNGVAACCSMALEIYAWLVHRLHILRQPPRVDDFIAEWPHVYASRIREGKTKEDPNDLPPLAGVSCALGMVLSGAHREHVEPSLWKGQAPGDTFTARILGRLEPEEIEVLAKALLRVDPILCTDRVDALLKHPTAHNAIDGVGIGLYRLGRLARRRVYSRGADA